MPGLSFTRSFTGKVFPFKFQSPLIFHVLSMIGQIVKQLSETPIHGDKWGQYNTCMWQHGNVHFTTRKHKNNNALQDRHRLVYCLSIWPDTAQLVHDKRVRNSGKCKWTNPALCSSSETNKQHDSELIVWWTFSFASHYWLDSNINGLKQERLTPLLTTGIMSFLF